MLNDIVTAGNDFSIGSHSLLGNVCAYFHLIVRYDSVPLITA